MGSTRLPGKAMRPLAGRTLVGQCLARLTHAAIGPVVLATTAESADDVLEGEAAGAGAAIFRGSTNDVLSRYVEIATESGADYVVRATGDNPAVDADSAVRLLATLKARKADYAVEEGLPYGSTLEVMKASALRLAGVRARDGSDREHVTSFLRRPGHGFRCLVLPAPEAVRRPDLRFTVDLATDLTYMRDVLWHAELSAGTLPPLARIILSADEVARRREVA
jgi:spore coat polysaccharide biosynthesis protein SpsF (cytidylyltransferase family)